VGSGGNNHRLEYGFIDSTVVKALPVLQAELKATAAQVQWIVESHALFLAALILVGSLRRSLGRQRIFASGIYSALACAVFA